MISLKVETPADYSNALPREGELIGIVTPDESGNHKLIFKDSAGSTHELSGGAGSLSELSDVSAVSAATDGQALVYDAAAETWKPGTVASGGTGSGTGGIPAVAIADGDPATGTVQVRPVTINSDGSTSWAGETTTAIYTWEAPNE